MNIDFDFIKELEGYELEGYVPDPENSQSGVTIASGFDLGHRHLSEMYDLFNEDLAEKLFPYCGFKKQDAVALLKQKPLIITDQEALEINMVVHRRASEMLSSSYYLETSLYFDDLPPICQTVIASVAFQYGNLAERTPNFWSQVCSRDWDAALANLRNFGDRYPTRRNKEADLLEHWMVSRDLEVRKTYKCVKSVDAMPMTRQQYNNYRNWTMPEGENPDDKGYLVGYNVNTPEYYETWLPKNIR